MNFRVLRAVCAPYEILTGPSCGHLNSRCGLVGDRSSRKKTRRHESVLRRLLYRSPRNFWVPYLCFPLPIARARCQPRSNGVRYFTQSVYPTLLCVRVPASSQSKSILTGSHRQDRSRRRDGCYKSFRVLVLIVGVTSRRPFSRIALLCSRLQMPPPPCRIASPMSGGSCWRALRRRLGVDCSAMRRSTIPHPPSA